MTLEEIKAACDEILTASPSMLQTHCSPPDVTHSRQSTLFAPKSAVALKLAIEALSESLHPHSADGRYAIAAQALRDIMGAFR